MVFASVLSTTSTQRLSINKPLKFTPTTTIQCSSSTSAAVSIQFDLKTYWTTLITEIDQKLDQAIQVQYPERIFEAMRYSVLATGAKRAPPIMCIAACELFGGNRLAAFPTACALEMVHAASLIHDDLPYMDDDHSRRGKQSNHTIFGTDVAILAGDALFPLGFRHIVTQTPPDLVPDHRILRIVTEIAQAVGSTGMSAGQILDRKGGPASVEFIQDKKYGQMSECSAACGGLLGGANEDEIERLRRYGRAIGVLYRVVDDLEKMERKGKSYVGVYGVEKAREIAEDLRIKAKRELDGFEKYGDKALPLYSFVDYAAHGCFSVHHQNVIAGL